MEIKSLYRLNRHFNISMAWRRKKLTQIKFLATAPGFEDDARDTLVRGAVTLLYAHWEGFVKDAATAYLEYVSRQDRSCEEMNVNFVALAMKARFHEAKEPHVAAKFIEVAQFFLSGLGETFKVKWDHAIDTQSNLKAKVFQEIVLTLGLDYAKYDTKENLIDEKLLGTRNKIAHGEYLAIDSTQYIELHDEVTTLMDRFGDEIMDAAQNKKYLRPIP